MMKPGIPPVADQSQFESRISQLRAELGARNPAITAKNCGAVYQSINDFEGEFQLPVWGQPVILSFPELIGRDQNTGQDLPLTLQALLLYYLRTANGASTSNRWVSFSELQNGRFYNLAYQGYTGNELGRLFGDDLNGFVTTAQSIGGSLQLTGTQPIPGDKACSFTALPRVSLLVAAWCGDEEFPSSFQILFDASANHYLPTDVCAILGSMLTKKLIAAYPAHRSIDLQSFGIQP